MGSSPTPWRAKVIGRWCLFFTIAFSLPVGGFLWQASSHSLGHRRMLDSTLAGVTRIRVWGAGSRAGNGFCSCAVVPKPEQVFYETRDPVEIRDLIGRIQPRRYLELEEMVATCGTVTMESLRGDEPVLWIHKMGRNLRSNKGVIPVTTESGEEIEHWLDQRRVRQSIQAALLQQIQR